jgi:hypothetical protein
MNNIIKINDELFLIKYIFSDEYEKLAYEWNNIIPQNRAFKKEGKLYLCEVIEEAIVIEDDVVTTLN